MYIPHQHPTYGTVCPTAKSGNEMPNSPQSMVTHEQQFSILFPLLYALLAYVFLFQMGSFYQGHNYFTELKVDFRHPLVTSGSEYPRVNQWRSYIVTRNDWSKLPQGKWTASPQKNVCSVTDSSGFGHALWLRSMGNYNTQSRQDNKCARPLRNECVSHQGGEPRPAQVLARDGRNTHWAIESVINTS